MSDENQRYDVLVPQADTAPILAFVDSFRASCLDEQLSEFAADEIERLRPGVEVLLELAGDDHQEAEEDFAHLCEALTCTDHSQLIGHFVGAKTIQHVRMGIATSQKRARSSLTARLEELVTIARALGVADDDFMALARHALHPAPAADDDVDESRRATVVPFPRQTRA